MFPVEIDGIVYPCFFKSQSKAMAAAYEFFDSLSKAVAKFSIVRGKTNNGTVYYVVKDKKGNALPLVREVD
ncbi:hypothetical protein NPS33_27730 [Pseudomonas putida]|jgi:hypothetical protein|uniref:hypothetical protein n=1 Tax=Pseudomonas putida TaxID=303 RepID=UPI00236412D5|nr:hypothetical protein [Pseudomonas putida]MDD2018627.1 hypothetical protein [Pseudomonas putida]HDS1775336.1 hypothetical protein [Pseudomonas putida]